MNGELASIYETIERVARSAQLSLRSGDTAFDESVALFKGGDPCSLDRFRRVWIQASLDDITDLDKNTACRYLSVLTLK